jgi:endogenous inhibitor of DNA gyrase (YacG/DUF329 family)
LRAPIAHINAMSAAADVPRPGTCPICGKPAIDAFRPFCGKRCRDVDLNRWLSGVYAVPVKEEEDEDGVPKSEEPR